MNPLRSKLLAWGPGIQVSSQGAHHSQH